MEKKPCAYKGLLCARACAFCFVRRLVRWLCAQACALAMCAGLCVSFCAPDLCAGPYVDFVRQALCMWLVRSFVRMACAPPLFAQSPHCLKIHFLFHTIQLINHIKLDKLYNLGRFCEA